MELKSGWRSLENAIEALLLDGKRSQHPDFQALFTWYGQEKVTKIAKEILARGKKKAPEEDPPVPSNAPTTQEHPHQTLIDMVCDVFPGTKVIGSHHNR